MDFQKIDENTARKLIAKLKSGGFWSNGLVGSESWCFKDNRFVVKRQDAREPNIEPSINIYTEEDFLKMILGYTMPKFVFESLLNYLQT